MKQDEPGYYEREMYRAAGQAALAQDPRSIYSLTPAGICNIASDAAVQADRKRMAEMVRSRVLHTTLADLPPALSMKVEEIFFDLANQIEVGMPFTGN